MPDPAAQDALLTFENALEELEALVARMEDGLVREVYDPRQAEGRPPHGGPDTDMEGEE